MFIVKILEKGAIGLLLTLDSIVFDLIGKAYNIFMAIAGARLLSADAYMKVANKIYAIVGVLMLFVLSYSILRSIIDPDKHLKEELGAKMVQRVVIAVVGLAMTPVLFNLLYQAQGLILESNILGNLFFNDEVLEDGTDPNSYLTQIGGNVTATSLWQAFFYPSEESGKDASEIEADPGGYLIGVAVTTCAAAGGIAALFIGIPVVNLLAVGAAALTCVNAANNAASNSGEKITLREAYTRTAAGDSFKLYLAFIDNYVDEGEISYTFIISTIAGGFCLYAFISFSIDMGVRAAKMAYLQIVAPIPLIMQVIPSNKDMFDKYLKSVKNTFMEVFIRISVVYVVVYIICHLPQLFSSTTALWGNTNLSGPSKLIALALLILGLIAFCRRAPDIISETLNIPKGDMKLGLRDKLAEGGAFAAGGILGAAATSGYRGARNYKPPKGQENNHFRNAMARMGRGVGGFFGAGGRAAWNQFKPGEGGKEAKNWQGMVDVASKASRAQDDSRRAKDQRAENRRRIQEQIDNQQTTVDRLNHQYQAAPAGPARDALKQQLEEEQKKLAQLRKELQENTELGNWAAERGKRIKIWAAGSFDLTLEDAAIKMGSAAGDLQDKLRQAITAKGSDELKAAYKQWQDAESENADSLKYKNGFTEESYNAEKLRRSQKATAVQNAVRNLKSAEDEMAAATASGDATRIALATANLDAAKKARDEAIVARTPEEMEIVKKATARARLQMDYDTAVAAGDTALAASLQTQMNTLDGELQAQQDALMQDLENRAINENYQQDVIALQNKRTRLKRIYEMMADAEIQMKLSKNDTDYTSIVANFLRDNADLIQNHPNMMVPIEVDVNGNVIKEVAISEFIERSFGAAALSGSLDPSTFDRPTTVVMGEGTAYEAKLTYDPSSNSYRDSAGNVYQPGQIAAHLDRIMAPHAGAALDIDSGVNRGKGQGKKIKNSMPTSRDYVDKKNLEREKEGKK